MSPSKSAQRWSAADYAANGRFVAHLGLPVVTMLAPRGGMRILDLGCGDGALTEIIAASGADVVGVDMSEPLLAEARGRGLDIRKADGQALPFEREFDAVFSNAALHWMPGAEAVIAGVARALKPRGRFVAEMGGHGNVAAIHTAMRAVALRYGKDPEAGMPFFPAPAQYRKLLEAAGFEVEQIDLIPRPTPLPGEMAKWLATFGNHLYDQFADEAERDRAVAETEALLRPALCDGEGNWTADYVRLRFAARLKSK